MGYLVDENLSYKAKGLLMVMLELSKRGSLLHESEIIEYSSDGKDSLRSGLKELEQTGYLHRRLVKGDDGRFSHREVEVYEEPRLA